MVGISTSVYSDSSAPRPIWALLPFGILLLFKVWRISSRLIYPIKILQRAWCVWFSSNSSIEGFVTRYGDPVSLLISIAALISFLVASSSSIAYCSILSFELIVSSLNTEARMESNISSSSNINFGLITSCIAIRRIVCSSYICVFLRWPARIRIPKLLLKRNHNETVYSTVVQAHQSIQQEVFIGWYSYYSLQQGIESQNSFFSAILTATGLKRVFKLSGSSDRNVYCGFIVIKIARLWLIATYAFPLNGIESALARNVS